MKRLWILLLIIAVLVGAYLIVNSRLDTRARAAVAALKAAGHPTTVEDMEPAFDTGSESTANVLKTAAGLLTKEDLDKLKYLDTLGWREDRAGLQAFLKDKAEVYELVMQAAAMPPADFGMSNWDSCAAKIATMLPQCAGFRLLLRIQARELAQNGRPDSALKVLAASSALTYAFAKPGIINHLVSMLGMDSVFSTAAQVAPKAGVPAIEGLITRFQGLDFKADEYRALQAEAVLAQVKAAAGQTTDVKGLLGLQGFLGRVLTPLRSYARARFVEFVVKQLEVLPKPWYEGRDTVARLDTMGRGKDPLMQLAGACMPNLSMFYERDERMMAWRDIAVLGLRALVMKKRTGRLPARLEDFASDAPPDRFSGKPYVYRVLPDGFMVHSVGTNGKDDNGTAPDDLVFKVTL
jgi:hypothetical protein